jgi:hypothetical protein
MFDHYRERSRTGAGAACQTDWSGVSPDVITGRVRVGMARPSPRCAAHAAGLALWLATVLNGLDGTRRASTVVEVRSAPIWTSFRFRECAAIPRDDGASEPMRRCFVWPRSMNAASWITCALLEKEHDPRAKPRPSPCAGPRHGTETVVLVSCSFCFRHRGTPLRQHGRTGLAASACVAVGEMHLQASPGGRGLPRPDARGGRAPSLDQGRVGPAA